MFDSLKEKRILIWGYGREGKSTERLLSRVRSCASFSVFEGAFEDIPVNDYDLIIKSPGIPYFGDCGKITSQTELFLEEYRNQVIGITGTKGKSTTSALMAHVLSECTGRKVLLLGNIGLPAFDFTEEITEDTIIVFELSCHQLNCVKVSPHISVFLNLFEEHLDYYRTMDKYFYAKEGITRNQTANDYLFVGETVPPISTNAVTEIISAQKTVGCDLSILGEHNKKNAYFVERVAEKCFGIPKEKAEEAMQSFRGLPHRLQKIAERDGITYYDDSISTIPEATVQAILSIPDVKTVLIGGMDRGIDYSVLEKFIADNPQYHYILMYSTGRRIRDELKENGSLVYYEEDLENAVKKAKELTRKGEAVLLSPAAASYDHFKNFEERGDCFKNLVLGEV